MATAEGVKTKIQGMITKVNQRAGKSFTNLTDAFNNLFDGVSIKGNLTQYKVLSGATVSAGDFVEFVASWGSGSVNSGTLTAVEATALTADKVLVCYTELTGVSYAAVITATGSGVTVGTVAKLDSGEKMTCLSVAALESNKALLAYKTSAGGFLATLDINDSTVSTGGSVSFTTSSVINASLVSMGINRVMLTYSSGYSYSSCPGTAVLVTVAGSSIQQSQEYVFANTAYFHKTVKLNDSKVLVVYHNRLNDSGQAGYAVVLSWGGSFWTKGTALNFRNALIDYMTATALDATKVVVAYQDGGSSNNPVATLLVVNDTNVSTYTRLSLETGVTGTELAITTLNGSKALATWTTGTGSTLKLRSKVLTVSGTTLTAGAVTTINTGDTAITKQTLIASADNSLVVVYKNVGAKYRGINMNGDTASVAALNDKGGIQVKVGTSSGSIAGVAKTPGSSGATIDVYRPK